MPQPQPTESPAAKRGAMSTVLGLRAWNMAFLGPVEIWYFSVFYLSLATQFQVPVLSALALVVSLMLYEAWGVLVNDIYDREVDLAAGKSGVRRGHTLDPTLMWALVLAAASASWALVLATHPTPVLVATWLVAYSLGILYSVPPFRFKNRGLLSLVCNSVLERPLPVLIIFLFFRYYGLETILFPILSELVWSVFKHQVHDYDEDLKANVRTYAVQIGKSLSYRVVRFVINPLGVLSVLAFAASAAIKVPEYSSVFLASLGITVVGVAVLLILERLTLVYTDPLDPPYMLFLDFSFLVTVILALAVIVLVRQPTYLPLVALFILSLIPHLRYYLPMLGTVIHKVAA